MMITITVNIPALSELVAYLKAKDDQQKEIDALAQQVSQLTAALQGSGAKLSEAVEKQQ